MVILSGWNIKQRIEQVENYFNEATLCFTKLISFDYFRQVAIRTISFEIMLDLSRFE